jgi:hypothetical protein
MVLLDLSFDLHSLILGDDFFLKIEQEIFKRSLNFIDINICSPKIVPVVAGV